MVPDEMKSLPTSPVAAGTLVIRRLAHRGLLLEGEADINSSRVLGDALRGLLDGPHEVHLGLAGLRFIDVSCMREIVAAAERHPAARVILHDPPPGLLHIARLLWPEPSFTVTGVNGYRAAAGGTR